jgi:SAM-dependent methyltransferase
MTKLLGFDELPIGVSSADMMAAFQPFIAGSLPRSSETRAVRHLRYRAARRAVERLTRSFSGGGTRDSTVIHTEYDEAWLKGYAKYDLSAGCRKPEPWTYRGERLMADRSGIPRLRSVILGAVLRSLKPRRVLEVGCGNGINLLLLAGSFPEIEFAGIELTDTGHRAARELQSAGVLPRHISDYAPLPQMDGSAFQRIEFLQGDATGMPFADGAFDLVFTILSVEQMERVRDAALREIARVSSRFVLNLEPFANANRSGWKRLNVYGRDYFRGRIADLPRYGLNPLWATMDYPQEIILGTALVLSRKTN